MCARQGGNSLSSSYSTKHADFISIVICIWLTCLCFYFSPKIARPCTSKRHLLKNWILGTPFDNILTIPLQTYSSYGMKSTLVSMNLSFVSSFSTVYPLISSTDFNFSHFPPNWILTHLTPSLGPFWSSLYFLLPLSPLFITSFPPFLAHS